LATEIAAHLADGRRGEILRDGVSVAIVGPPNAGKSSLINALARRDVAIVAATAGTTRDVIEVRLDLEGYPVILADTAGLREAHDPVEEEGVARAHARAHDADLKLVILDAGQPWEVRSVSHLIDAAALVVLNKIDIRDRVDPAAWPNRAIPISVVTGEGMPALLGSLGAAVRERFTLGAAPALTRTRHRTALEECLAALNRSRKAPLAELRAEDLRLAVRSLGRITGKVDVEELLDIIFRDFCIGK
jgi:tRNA modification GTPase